MLRTHLTRWKPSNFEIYGQAYQQFGGSTYNHPRVLNYLENLRPGTLRYYHKMHQGQLLGACFCGPDGQLEQSFKHVPIIAENIILPLSPSLKGYLPVKTKRLSAHHQPQFFNMHYGRGNRRAICLVKEQFSKSTVRGRNYYTRRFLAQGGKIVPVSEFNANELSDIYVRLFDLRWAGQYRCENREQLKDFMQAMKDLIFGHVLYYQDQPCAYDLIYQAQCPEWHYFDNFNGGYDPAITSFSLGSILLWENLLAAQRQSASENKRCIYSIGMASHKWPYKNLWAVENKMGKTLF